MRHKNAFGGLFKEKSEVFYKFLRFYVHTLKIILNFAAISKTPIYCLKQKKK